MFLNGNFMKFPQKFRAGDYIQWRLNSTTDNFGEPISSPDWSVNYYFRIATYGFWMSLLIAWIEIRKINLIF